MVHGLHLNIYVLLVRTSLPMGDCIVVLPRLVRLHCLLRDHVDASVAVGLYADSLVV